VEATVKISNAIRRSYIQQDSVQKRPSPETCVPAVPPHLKFLLNIGHAIDGARFMAGNVRGLCNVGNVGDHNSGWLRGWKSEGVTVRDFRLAGFCLVYASIYLYSSSEATLLSQCQRRRRWHCRRPTPSRNSCFSGNDVVGDAIGTTRHCRTSELR